jgi:hypothetical protein
METPRFRHEALARNPFTIPEIPCYSIEIFQEFTKSRICNIWVKVKQADAEDTYYDGKTNENQDLFICAGNGHYRPVYFFPFTGTFGL